MTVNISNYTITVTKTAVYHINYSVSFSGVASHTYEVAIFSNADQLEKSTVKRALSASGEIGVIASAIVEQLFANDVLTLQIVDTTSGGGSVTVVHANLNAVELN